MIWCGVRDADVPFRHERRARIRELDGIGHGVSIIGDILEGRHESCQFRPVTMVLCGVNVPRDSYTTRHSHGTRNFRKRFCRIRHVDVSYDVQFRIWSRESYTHPIGHRIDV